MDPTTIIGVVLGIGLLAQSVGFDRVMTFFIHPESMLIVFGGTLAATIVHFPLHQLVKISYKLKILFVRSKTDYRKDIDFIINVGDTVRKSGRLEASKLIESHSDSFVVESLNLYLDNVPVDQIKEIMESKMACINERHDKGILFFEQMAKYAPGFGLLGTLIGLVVLLAELENPQAIGPNMSIALVTTLYGVLLSNLLFMPLAGRLRVLSYDELFEKQMIQEGIISLAHGDSNYIIQEKMKTYLTSRVKKQLAEKG
jgi:chemotaxis protein MotA